jgi:serralysin
MPQHWLGTAGPDVMAGGDGDDYYYVNHPGDVVNEAAGEGTDDRVYAKVDYTLTAGSHVELLLAGDSNWGSVNLTGNELDNLILYGRTASGGGGDDILRHFVVQGDGGEGNDWLEPTFLGAAQTLIGGTGDDYFVVDRSDDVVVEFEGEGIDTIETSVSYALGEFAEVEKLIGAGGSVLTGNGFDNLISGGGVLSGMGGADVLQGSGTLHGGDGADTLLGSGGDDFLHGDAGVDTMTGGDGNDWYYIDADDTVIETAGGGTADRIFVGFSYILGAGFAIENLSTTDTAGTVAINLAGNELANSIAGNAGSNVLDGGAGADTLSGLDGDDWFYVDNAGDVVIEGAGGGTADRVFASVSYVLTAGAHIETMTTTDHAGTGAVNLTGNELSNSIGGNAGNNVLNGGGGADELIGFGGNDWLYVDNAGDVIFEAAGGGTDRVLASISYTLGAGTHVEILSTTNAAGTAAINLAGNELINSVAGNNGANVLNGGGGADTLNGLGGNDWFYVDDADDLVLEAVGGGTDRVLTSVSYALGAAEVEIVSTTNSAGTEAINLTGNAFVNSIAGNAGNNVLNGGAGADTLNGLGGNDWFYVDNAADVIVEAAGGGSDRVLASVSYTLGAAAQVEILSTTNNAGTGAINLTGNGVANSIAGNNGANVLNGGAGADTLNGLGGNDWFYVDNAADTVIEYAGGGSDRVLASVNYILSTGAQVEILSTTNAAGLEGLNLTGNEFANSIAGNDGANVLDGKGGSDTLNGLGGVDTFRFTTALGAGNVDTIIGYSAAQDAIELDNAVFTGLAVGVLAAGAFTTGAAATEADDRIIYNGATGALLFDADGNGAGAAVQFATIAGAPALAASEFFVI